MKTTLKGVLLGGVVAGVVMGIVGLTMVLDGSPPGPRWVAGGLGFLVSGFYGAIPGGIVGGVIGLVVAIARRFRRRVPIHATTQAPASAVPEVVQVPAPPLSSGKWIGTVGEALETRATVDSIEEVRNLRAERKVRWLHRLHTAGGYRLRWLANDHRGLEPGDQISLRGTVKEHTWADGASVTDVWYCNARKVGPVAPSAAKVPANEGDELSPSVDWVASQEAIDELTPTQAQENEEKRPRLMAPVKPAPDPVTRSGVDLRDPERLNKVLDELDALPGLELVAGQVRTLANRVRLNEARKARGMAVAEVGMHAVFVGPPGTGKTTVARIWGRVLAGTGLLPSGHVIETDRVGLVGQHVGSTAQKTTEVIDSARGGVLFVDEAYSLTPDGPASNDFGSEAVDALLKRMEDSRADFAVIVAGYDSEMERFLESNPGLRSRFAQTISFPNYHASALQTILESLARKGDYRIAPDAEEMLARSLRRLAAAPPSGWANARSMRALLSAMIDAQAERLVVADLDAEDLGLLTDPDVRTALQRLYPQVT